MANVERLVELAKHSHEEEIRTYNRLHKVEHDRNACADCVYLRRAEKMVEAAAEHGEYVVLYVP